MKNEILNINNGNFKIVNDDQILIIVKNSRNEILENTKAVVESFLEGVNNLPSWFYQQFSKWNADDIWNDEFLMTLEEWQNAMLNKTWGWNASNFSNGVIKIMIEQNQRTNLKELIFILYSQGIKLEHITIEDRIYGIYSLKTKY